MPLWSVDYFAGGGERLYLPRHAVRCREYPLRHAVRSGCIRERRPMSCHRPWGDQTRDCGPDPRETLGIVMGFGTD
jgi:hypothetical protein